MGGLIGRWIGEAIVGAIVTWALSHLGDTGTFTGLALCGGSMGITALSFGAQLHFAGVLLAFSAGVAFPFVGANAYEQAQDRPISAVVQEEDRGGSTWDNVGDPLIEDITDPITDPEEEEGNGGTTEGPDGQTQDPEVETSQGPEGETGEGQTEGADDGGFIGGGSGG